MVTLIFEFSPGFARLNADNYALVVFGCQIYLMKSIQINV